LNSSVASDSAGNFVVVWKSAGGLGADTKGQRYDASGSALGGEFQVNTYPTYNIGTYGYNLPSVASDSSGNFVVLWASDGSFGDNDSGSVQGQAYDASGSATGGQFQVNSYTTGYQTFPTVASGPAGKFVVVWASDGSPGSDTDSWSVQGQRYLPEPSFAPSLGTLLALLVALARRRQRS
jgi:hypothetical protein